MTLAREGSPNIPIAQQTGCLPHALGALQIVSLSGRTVVGGLGGSPCFLSTCYAALGISLPSLDFGFLLPAFGVLHP